MNKQKYWFIDSENVTHWVSGNYSCETARVIVGYTDVETLSERNEITGSYTLHTSPVDRIAKTEFRIETLETRNSDRLDFYSLAVWSLRAALQSAYAEGLKDGRNSIDNS